MVAALDPPLTASSKAPGAVMSGTSTISRRLAYSGRASRRPFADALERTEPLTVWPALRKASTVRAAMYPLAPVTRTVL